MAYNVVPTVANGDSWSAAQHNTYIKDNLAALWPYTTTGDMSYASSPNTLGRVAIGAAGALLRSSGSAPQWLARGSANQILKVNAAGTNIEWGTDSAVGAQARRNTTQSISNATYTALSYNEELWDSGTNWTSGANATKIFAPVTGKYLITAYVGWLANANNFREVYIAINAGAPVVYDSRVAVNGGATRHTMVGSTPMVAGQYAEIYVWQNSGGALNVNALESALSITLIGI